MNPIEKDLRSYFGITSESNILEHYGTKRHSGRYPWGSGDNPYQHSGDFLSRVEELKKKGLSEKEILETINDSLPDEYKMGLTEFRTARQKAGHDRKALEYDQIRALKDDGLGWKEIGDKLGMSESSVRSKYNNAIGEKASQAEKIAATLKEEVDKKGMIDISEGANQVLGVSESKLDEAAYILEAEYGYQRYGVGIRQPTNVRQQTNITVLAKPEFDQKYAYQHQDQIDSLGDYHSDDGGETFTKLQRPSSLDSSRVAIRYGDEGGLDKDGVMEIRRGVPDLDLGKSHYAQVRILVDGDHFLYVNGEYRGDSDIGKLMHDFNCTSAEEMNFDLMAERTRYLKENPKGVGSMCKAMEELRVESYAEGKAEGVEIGKMEQAKKTALKLSRKGNSVEEIADLLGYDVDTVSSWIAPKAC